MTKTIEILFLSELSVQINTHHHIFFIYIKFPLFSALNFIILFPCGTYLIYLG